MKKRKERGSEMEQPSLTFWKDVKGDEYCDTWEQKDTQQVEFTKGHFWFLGEKK